MYYASAIHAGDLQRSGSLLTATTLSLSASDINNTGDIAADEDLTLRSANNILNRGSVRSGADLSVISQSNIRNIGGHISSSGNMLLVARTGDIELGRDVKQVAFQRGGRHEITQIGTQSKVQSDGDAVLQAGDDISLIGSTLKAANDVSVSAEGDIRVEAVQDRSSSVVTGRKRYRKVTETIRQLASNIEAGKSVTLDSGQDIIIRASDINAGEHIALTATDDVRIESAANKQHSDVSLKRYRNTHTKVQQRKSTITAGTDITIDAGKDIAVTGSELNAEGDIRLAAQADTTIESAQDSDYSIYYKKKKKSFGRSKTKTRESEHVRNVASSLNAGGDVLINTRKTDSDTLVLNRDAETVAIVGSDINAGNDIAIYAEDGISASPGTDYDYNYYKKSKKGLFGTGSSKTITSKQYRQQRAQINSGDDINLEAGNNITLIAPTLTATDDIEINADNQVYLGAAKDSDYLHEEYSKTGAFKWEFGNEGHLDETVRHTQITAGGDIKIDAGNGIIIEYKHNGTLTESIASLSRLPELAWMSEVQQRDNIDWQAIEEDRQQWAEHEEGIGGPGVTLVMIAIAIATNGLGVEMLGAAAAGTLSVMEGIQIAVVNSLVNQAASSLITNGGDIGAVLSDLLSKEGLLGLATAGITAGITNGLFDSLDIPQGVSLSQLDTTQLVQTSLINASVKSTLDAALYGESFGDAFKRNLQTAAVSAVGAKLTAEIGQTYHSSDQGSADEAMQLIAHAAVGCGVSIIG